MADAHYLVQQQLHAIELGNREAQDNMVRRVARDIAQGEVCILQIDDANKYCRKARSDIRRLRSLGFRCRAFGDMQLCEGLGHAWYVTTWMITLPQQ